MDGNGRWASQQNLPRYQGHHQGVKNAKSILEESVKQKIKHLTLFAFSIENNHRPKKEVEELNFLFVQTLDSMLDALDDGGIKLTFFGDLELLSDDMKRCIDTAHSRTENNSVLHVSIALNYSGRWDIAQGIVRAQNYKGELTIDNASQLLPSSHIPEVDLLIRTGGQSRISNFMLWQLAYSELYFSPKLWPSFTVDEFHNAISWFNQRTRTFGLVNEE